MQDERIGQDAESVPAPPQSEAQVNIVSTQPKRQRFIKAP
jgi:hypothetical protein